MKKQLPYGLSDYFRIQKDNYYFVDKTHFIEKLENRGNYLIFFRPKRFGKSFLVSMLEAYYDKALKKQFRSYFRDTYISHKFQKNKSSFYILKFNFSEIGVDNFNKEFDFYLNLVLSSFINKYKLDIELSENPIELLNNIIEYFKTHNDFKLFVIIDEYDSFTNQLLFDKSSSYEEFITHLKDIKEFVKLIRAGITETNAPIKKLFITGNTPITLFDIVNDFQLLENISLEKEFNDLVGFNQKEIDDMLEYYDISSECKDILKEWYGGYKFNPYAKNVYNPNMVLYFIKHYLASRHLPNEMLDMNNVIHYEKFNDLLFSKNSLNENFEIIHKLLANSEIEVEKILEQFGGRELQDGTKFISLFFYFGFFTIKKKEMELVLSIPNEEIKKIIFNYMNNFLNTTKLLSIDNYALQNHLKDFANNGSLEIFKYISNEIKNSYLNDYTFNRDNIKAIYRTFLGLSDLYLIKTPKELNKEKFSDVFLKPFNDKVLYFGIVNIIHIPKQDKLDKTKIDLIITEETEMLNLIEYDEDIKFFLNQGKQFLKINLVFYGNELVSLKLV